MPPFSGWKSCLSRESKKSYERRERGRSEALSEPIGVRKSVVDSEVLKRALICFKKAKETLVKLQHGDITN
jgi:hypothetical protein